MGNSRYCYPLTVCDMHSRYLLGCDGNEAISLEITCETQPEIDHYWEKLSEGGEEGPCGWLKDQFGLSWQVTPAILSEMLRDEDGEKTQRVTDAFLQMKKLDIDAIQKAYDGE